MRADGNRRPARRCRPGARAAGGSRPDRPRAPLSVAAVGRRAAARRAGARALERSANPAGRRADGQPRHRQRRSTSWTCCSTSGGRAAPRSCSPLTTWRWRRGPTRGCGCAAAASTTGRGLRSMFVVRMAWREMRCGLEAPAVLLPLPGDRGRRHRHAPLRRSGRAGDAARARRARCWERTSRCPRAAPWDDATRGRDRAASSAPSGRRDLEAGRDADAWCGRPIQRRPRRAARRAAGRRAGVTRSTARVELDGGGRYTHALLETAGSAGPARAARATRHRRRRRRRSLATPGSPFAGVVLAEPGRRAGAFSFGTRVFVDLEDLKASGLLGFGSRATHRMLVKMPEPGRRAGWRATCGRRFAASSCRCGRTRSDRGRTGPRTRAGRELPQPGRPRHRRPRRRRGLERDSRLRPAEAAAWRF